MPSSLVSSSWWVQWAKSDNATPLFCAPKVTSTQWKTHPESGMAFETSEVVLQKHSLINCQASQLIDHSTSRWGKLVDVGLLMTLMTLWFDAAKPNLDGTEHPQFGFLFLDLPHENQISAMINRPSQSQKMLPKYIGKAESTNILSKSIKK